MHPADRGQDRSRRQRTVVWVVLGVVLAAFAALLVWAMGISSETGLPVSGGAAGQTEAPPGTAVRLTDSQTLVGRWVRIDTPYIIEIESASEDGTLEVSYYNPRSINVSRAEARDKNGATEVFVELRDTNYPGSTYTLTYDPAGDLLRGVYFHAVLRQSFDVVFARLPAETGA